MHLSLPFLSLSLTLQHHIAHSWSWPSIPKAPHCFPTQSHIQPKTNPRLVDHSRHSSFPPNSICCSSLYRYHWHSLMVVHQIPLFSVSISWPLCHLQSSWDLVCNLATMKMSNHNLRSSCILVPISI